MSAEKQVQKLKEQSSLKKETTVSIQSLIEKSAQELGKALPAHMRPERIVRIALTTLRMNPKLYQCDPQSFLAALFQSAQLGLEPNVEGQAYIIPYNSKRGLVAQFQIGYKGYIELFWRHQSSVSLQMESVHEEDSFNYDLGANEISHVPPSFGQKRGAVIGYYAVAHLANGGRAIKVMSKDEAIEYGKKYSKTWNGQSFDQETPWAKEFDAMAKKSVLKQLMKLLPKSVEIQRAIAMDETVKNRVSPDMFEVTPVPEEIGNAEVLPEEGKIIETKDVPENWQPSPEEQAAIKQRELDIAKNS